MVLIIQSNNGELKDVLFERPKLDSGILGVIDLEHSESKRFKVAAVARLSVDCVGMH